VKLGRALQRTDFRYKSARPQCNTLVGYTFNEKIETGCGGDGS
jgi:hypothetical protein